MPKQQSLVRLAAKSTARTAGKRKVKQLLGNGILGALGSLLVSEAVKLADKYEVHSDESFGTTSIEKRG